MISDLRSDTVTRPGKEMLSYMMDAPVGDMVFGEDPMVNKLESKAAHMFGMDASIFCPSGTMTNQIAVKIHTNPGDDVICSKPAHIYQYEAGGIAFHSAASVTLIETENGIFTRDDVQKSLQPDDPHKPVSRLVVAENTVNMGGGAVWNIEELRKISNFCKKNHLRFHLDGARLFNAAIRNNDDLTEYGKIFDTISICLSKGLGAPVGSMLIGNRDFIGRGIRYRKLMGGTMRQAGYLAAAGLFALENNIERLKDDHDNATRIANTLKDQSWVDSLFPVYTNIIIARINSDISAGKIVTLLSNHDILVLDIGNNCIRIVTHLDISSSMTEHICDVIGKLEVN